MKIGRRSFVKSGVATVVVAPLLTQAITTPNVAIALFDSRTSVSRSFATRFGAAARDVSMLHSENWVTFRRTLPAGPIVGLTTWSDLVIARGYAEEQGRRIRYERRLGHLFEWKIV